MAQTSINSPWSTALHPTLSQGHQVRLSYTWGSGAIVSIQILQHLRVPPEPRARGRQWAMDALRGWDQESDTCCTVKKLSFWFSWLSQVGKAPKGQVMFDLFDQQHLTQFSCLYMSPKQQKMRWFHGQFRGLPGILDLCPYWTPARYEARLVSQLKQLKSPGNTLPKIEVSQ